MERHTYLSIKQQQSFLPIMPRRAYPYLSIKGCGTNYTNYPTQVSIKSRSHKPPPIPGHLESFTNYTTQIPGPLEFPAWLAGHRQPGVEVTVGGVTCLKKSVYMSGLLVIGRAEFAFSLLRFKSFSLSFRTCSWHLPTSALWVI